MEIFRLFGKKNKDSIEFRIEKNLPLNTLVNLWLKPNTDLVYVYEYGFLSGEGLIGQHENNRLASHLRNDKAFEAKVIANKMIEVKLFEKTKEEMLNEEYLKNEYPNLLIELSKPIKVNEILARLYISKESKIKNDEYVYPVFLPTIEDHIKERLIKLNFIDGECKVAGIKKNEPNKIRQILRLHFANKVNLRGKILNIKNNEAEIIIERNNCQ
jgi:hypothetical protein